MAVRLAQKHQLDIRLTPQKDPYVWNSLMRSEILQPRDLEDRKLGGPLRLQKLYSSSQQGRAAFFEYMREAAENFERRLLIVKTDDRFSVGVFLRGPVAWDSDAEVDQNGVVCSFMRRRPASCQHTGKGREDIVSICGDNVLQLFDKQRANSFIFMTRPPAASGADLVTSIALNKISQRVQKQCGRVHRSPVVTLEIHVVSCRDRIAHQAFDLRFEHIQTEETMKRFDYTKQTFAYHSIATYDWGGDNTGSIIFDSVTSVDVARQMLSRLDDSQLLHCFGIAVQHRVETHVFAIFDILLGREELVLEDIRHCMDAYPSLVYCILKKYIPEGPAELPEDMASCSPSIIRNILRSANEMGIAALAALERLLPAIESLDLATYLDLLWSAAICVRSFKLVQEILLVLHESRNGSRASGRVLEFAHKHALGVVFDRVEEAADTCPCDDYGKPRKQSTRPARAKLVPPQPRSSEEEGGAVLDDGLQGVGIAVVAHTRVDLPKPIRIHNHVRLQVASVAPNSTLPRPVVDATVTRAGRGELYLDVKQPLPPEWQEVDWSIFDAGGIATSAAMLAAVQKLALKGYDCCRLHHVIVGLDPATDIEEHVIGQEEDATATSNDIDASLNYSQQQAVRTAVRNPMSLIWGPPGTGKTTVVVQILVQYLRRFPEGKILMTASTHNAVDNVLERFVAYNNSHNLLDEDKIIRAATESSKVNKALQRFTVDSRLGGSVTDNPRLVQKAVKRVKEARMVFTTCSGAGLACFATVQLRPTVKPMGKVLEFDKSLFERLWRGRDYPDLARSMLEVQYRFSEDVARFPSEEFYEGRLQTGTPRDDEIATTLGISSFPWPKDSNGRISPVVFVPCTSEEDYGRSSKSNAGQVALVKYIVSLLRRPSEASEEHQTRLRSASIAVLTPYSRQVQLLKQTIPGSMDVVVSTIDGFQGREGDIVVFSTVRCNVEGDIGFVEDERRLNVAWTRPKLGLIVIGDRRTLEATSALWKRALAACKEVVIARPEEA
ncbi:P-loop containing nucleoside triphosphate hydrolase protein [Cerioporus squamosus]|nr:P-loop containing nucleoside triphosphate hydrolase protein [Cerioporus squamosus]